MSYKYLTQLVHSHQVQEALTMKSERVFLNELNPYSKNYTVKVKVVEKNRPKESPQKKVKYQSLVLQDEKGNKMKAALFGEQVDGYKDVIMYNGEYEIANAIIKPINERWKSNADELDYQMSIGKYTVVQQADGILEPLAPQYVKLSTIPRFACASDRFDVLVIVLYVEEGPGRVVKFGTRESIVRELLVIDDSIDRPLLISAWNELAEKDCEQISSGESYLPVIGLTALKPSSHKGFSLTTTMSTVVEQEPVGEQAKDLHSWIAHNRLQLNKTRLKIQAARCDAGAIKDSTIGILQTKKAADVLQDEKYNLVITMPDADIEKINAYIGCSACGKATDAPLGKYFPCEACHKPNCKAAPKVTFKCEVTDGTRSFLLTFFTDSCEQLFDLTAADLFHLRTDENISALAAAQAYLQDKTISIQVAPSTSLTRNRVLQWVVHQINPSKSEKIDNDNAATPSTKRHLQMPAGDDSPEVPDKQAEVAPPIKRRLILRASSDSSDEANLDVEVKQPDPFTMSQFNEDLESPSPVPSPRTPLTE